MAMRNYRAMNPDKLVKCLVELELRSGDAYERVMAKGESLEAHKNAARAAANMKNVTVPASQPVADDLEDDDSDGSAPLASGGRGTVRYIAPQLAYDVHGDFGAVPKQGWIMEPKFDGWRWQVHVTDLGVASIGGRNGKRHDGAAPLVDEWLSAHVPLGTVLDGEVLWEDGKSSNASSAVFVVFDVLVVEDDNICSLPWTERRGILEDLLERSQRKVLPDSDPKTGRRHTSVRISPYARVDEAVFDHWLDLGMEGCVAKRETGAYHPGSRRQDGWLKVKPASTTDAIVVGYQMGKGAGNKHLVGALDVVLVDTNVQTSCGYSATPEEAERLKGRRVELAHYGWFDSGNVRHPIFKRLRKDLVSVA